MRPPQPQLIDLEQYEESYKARKRGESLSIFSDWISSSWRTGWSDAGKDIEPDPDFHPEPSPQSPLDLKGNK
jgi:hypothetical protein